MDTNVFFGASYPVDRLNTWAEQFVETCRISEIPLYININIRSEFLDLYRRVLVVESLLMIRSIYAAHLTPQLEKWLKALQEKVRAGINDNRSAQIDERTLKEFRKTLLQLLPNPSESGNSLWDIRGVCAIAKYAVVANMMKMGFPITSSFLSESPSEAPGKGLVKKCQGKGPGQAIPDD